MPSTPVTLFHCGAEDPGFPASLKCFSCRRAPQLKRFDKGTWAPNLDAELIGQSLSHWLKETRSTTLDDTSAVLYNAASCHVIARLFFYCNVCW
jgi:hypothetical protein